MAKGISQGKRIVLRTGLMALGLALFFCIGSLPLTETVHAANSNKTEKDWLPQTNPPPSEPGMLQTDVTYRLQRPAYVSSGVSYTMGTAGGVPRDSTELPTGTLVYIETRLHLGSIIWLMVSYRLPDGTEDGGALPARDLIAAATGERAPAVDSNKGD